MFSNRNIIIWIPALLVWVLLRFTRLLCPTNVVREQMHNLPETEWKETTLKIDYKISLKEVTHWDDENRTGLNYNKFSCCRWGAYHGCDDPGFPEHQSAANLVQCTWQLNTVILKEVCRVWILFTKCKKRKHAAEVTFTSMAIWWPSIPTGFVWNYSLFILRNVTRI
jgi:hypothetical protein